MVVLLDPPPIEWVCANGCGVVDVTPTGTPNRFHTCRVLHNITAPLVRAGERTRVRAIIREDYVGNEIVQYDDLGRPVAAVVTDRPDGSNDVAVLAPTATIMAGVN